MYSSTVNIIQEEPAAASVNPKKAPVTQDTKKLVYNAYKYFKQQKNNKDSFEYQTDANISNLVAMATSVPQSTVRQIIIEANKAIERTGTATFCDNHKGGNFKSKFTANNCRHYRLGRIRKMIYQMYTVEKVCPSLSKLAVALKQNDIINYSCEMLRRLLHKIGYYYERRCKNRFVLLETADIIEKRFDYLTRMLKCRSNNNNNIFFIGETKIFPILYSDVGLGCEVNVIVAGNQNGLITNSVEVYESNQDITPTVFQEWVEHKLKNNLPRNSVVIMGSEPYHCMAARNRPTMESLKHEMHEWLHERDIHFAPDMCKVELLKIINSIPSQKNYTVDKMLQHHTVLHVPRFHTDLNPMWLVLEDVKEDLLRECVLTLEEKSKALKKLISEYPADKFQKYDKIISGNEKEYWSYDMKMDRVLDELILGVNGGAPTVDSSDSDNETDDDSSALSNEDNSE